MKALVKELNNRGYMAEEKDVIKNGVTFHGIMVGEGNIKPVFYPQPGTTADEIIAQFKQVAETQFDIGALTDPEYIMSNVYIGLQRKSKNGLVTKATKYKGIEQYLYVKMNNNTSFKMGAAMIPKSVTCDEVWKNAKKNTFAKTEIMTMSEIMSEFGMQVPETPLYVVTNADKYRGSANILDRKSLVKTLGHGEFIVIPSSIHEMLILPAEEYDNLADLAQLVKEINASQVAPEEQLGDTVYKITL